MCVYIYTRLVLHQLDRGKLLRIWRKPQSIYTLRPSDDTFEQKNKKKTKQKLLFSQFTDLDHLTASGYVVTETAGLHTRGCLYWRHQLLLCPYFTSAATVVFVVVFLHLFFFFFLILIMINIIWTNSYGFHNLWKSFFFFILLQRTHCIHTRIFTHSQCTSLQPKEWETLYKKKVRLNIFMLRSTPEYYGLNKK